MKEKSEDGANWRSEITDQRNGPIRFYRGNRLTIWILTGAVLGVVLGIVLRVSREEPYTEREAMYVGILGQIFLQMLKVVALPLMVGCLVCAFATLDRRISAKIGLQLIVFILITKIEVVILAIVLTMVLRPGHGVSESKEEKATLYPKNLTVADTFLDMVRNMFPSNLAEMCLMQYETVLIPPTNATLDLQHWVVKPGGTMKEATNLLGVVCVSIAFGVAFNTLQEMGKPAVVVVTSFSRSTFLLIKWILWVSPFLLVSLVAGEIVKMRKPGDLIARLGMYFVCLILGHIIHLSVAYIVIYFVITRKNPFTFVGQVNNFCCLQGIKKIRRILITSVGTWDLSVSLFWSGLPVKESYELEVIPQMAETLATAFATTSSIACIPLAIKNLEEKAGVDPMIARFVIPVGINVNKDGTALSLGVQAIFISQLSGITLTVGQVASVIFLAASGSVAAAGVSHATLVSLVIVLNSLGLPPSSMGLLLAVDFVRDRMATVLNVMGNCVVAAIVNHLNEKMTRRAQQDEVDQEDKERQEAEEED
uniref:Amino acid transporter n=1 Tax=Timema bartmani TaxID=61472 RepID=A0A7R9EN20_9NEOP|nr:unnamed protein product [Timema bartmani]